MSSVAHSGHSIEITNLVKHYPKATANAIDDISFTVEEGEIFGLLGPNGAGKTTLLGMLTTTIRPTKGSMTLLGMEIYTNLVRVKQSIAVVPQRSNLDRSLRVGEILTFHATYHGIPLKESRLRANKLLAEFGLADRGNERLAFYSGGLEQRVMLARALMHTPSVLFLDEPTNNLDPQSRLFLWDRIQDLRDRGITIFLNTHDMEEADRLCNRVAIIDHGRVLALDTPAELKKLIPGGVALDLYLRLPVSHRDSEKETTLSAEYVSRFAELPDVLKAEERQTFKQEDLPSGIRVVRLYSKHAGSLIIDASRVVMEMGMEIYDMHLIHPSLEDVFIQLTGRTLRS